MFGAWQAGAWVSIERRTRIDLVVGCSVGSLNGYSIACGASPERLRSMWLTPELAQIKLLEQNLRAITSSHHPRIPFGVTLTDLFRLKPVLFEGPQVTWRHLLASCALPGLFRPVRIAGRWYVDGGLVNNLPIWAALEMGATHVIALNALPETPGWWLKPIVKGFRALAGFRAPRSSSAEVHILSPARLLGGPVDVISWNKQNVLRWLEQGEADAEKNISLPICPEG